MPLFSFQLNTFQITDTRSAHKDTDFVTLTLKVGNAPPQTICKPMGNLNNGTFNPGLNYAGVNIDENTQVVLNYLIFNSSIAANAAQAGLETLGSRLAVVPGLNLPPLASAVQSVSTQFAQEIATIVNPGSCDGLVAAEQNSFTYAELIDYSSQFPFFSQATAHVGTKAPGNCNSKPSAYVVHWSMMQLAAVPNLIGLSLGLRQSPSVGTAYYTLEQNHFQGQILQGHPTGAGAQVSRQSPEPGQLAYVGYIVELTTTLAP